VQDAPNKKLGLLASSFSGATIQNLSLWQIDFA
jgi:hypothetical protein